MIRCCLLVAALLVLLAGCGKKEQELNWNLTGTWITVDGEIGEAVPFSIEGKLVTEGIEIGKPQIVDFRIQWSEDFPYQNGKYEPYAAYPFSEQNDTDFLWFWCSGFAYDPKKNTPVVAVFTLSLEKGYSVMTWPYDDSRYLVASTDPETNPQEILNWYFSHVYHSLS